MLFTCLIPVTAKNKSRISLNDEWQFKQSISQNWLPAQVPGAVHTDLMNNRMIKDPFYGVNEKSLQWIGEKDWEYCILKKIGQNGMIISKYWNGFGTSTKRKVMQDGNQS